MWALPAINPRDSLIRHIGSFVDYGGNNKVLSEAVVANYPDIKTTNGCGLILLESGDNIIVGGGGIGVVGV